MKPTSQQLRDMRRQSRVWPVELIGVSRSEWPVDGAVRLDVMRSRQFLVQIFPEADGILRLSVNRTEWNERQQRWRDDISWDDRQRLKREAGYGDRWAVEIYPADSDIVNVANMRHLWLLPSAPSFAWRTLSGTRPRAVLLDEVAA
ncbi:hypothetical protein [Sphingomonas sp. TREG-RG-20F-R18-01]|uniref:DUF7694 domain-containing protein n=1 Tax=Sphingomonas sp. TREG-RG-20F-R18-01 TaxID=2914982 RepID=UPI001F5A6C3B|nr:hypothetical protein [Sphingomonas sp. TREG-RG-20F-R18-01]